MAERITKAVTVVMPMAIRAYRRLMNRLKLKVYISMGFTAFLSFGVCVICIWAYFLFVIIIHDHLRFWRVYNKPLIYPIYFMYVSRTETILLSVTYERHEPVIKTESFFEYSNTVFSDLV